MAEKMPVKDSVRDATRESLIALSYSSPEMLSNSPNNSNKVKYVGNTISEKDGSVDYWSELISLSYPTSDAESRPQAKA
ncbi:hypothetical protein SOVF_152260 [Spinacia oleracea]|nr:hypothetical protein SOVF_152260 [Spinacia oleracea]